jgi:hypothetical protein
MTAMEDATPADKLAVTLTLLSGDAASVRQISEVPL